MGTLPLSMDSIMVEVEVVAQVAKGNARENVIGTGTERGTVTENGRGRGIEMGIETEIERGIENGTGRGKGVGRMIEAGGRLVLN